MIDFGGQFFQGRLLVRTGHVFKGVCRGRELGRETLGGCERCGGVGVVRQGELGQDGESGGSGGCGGLQGGDSAVDDAVKVGGGGRGGDGDALDGTGDCEMPGGVEGTGTLHGCGVVWATVVQRGSG